MQSFFSFERTLGDVEGQCTPEFIAKQTGRKGNNMTEGNNLEVLVTKHVFPTNS